MVTSSPNVASVHALRALAEDLFVLGYPLLLTDAVRRAHPVGSGQILFLPEESSGIAPGLDGEDVNTVLTSAWIDVDASPVVLHVPDPGGRHFTLTLVGSYGQIIASFGARSGHSAGGVFAVASAKWQGVLAEGSTVVRAPPVAVWAITRITALSPDDRCVARRLAAEQRLTSPDATAGGPQATMLTVETPSMSCAQRVLEMTPETFLHRLTMLLDRLAANDETGRSETIRSALQALQAAPQDIASAEARQAIVRGFADGIAAIREAADPAAREPLGEWRARGPFAADTALGHAANAYSALGAPLPREVLTLVCRTDETGRFLQGSERYRIHFVPGGTPPADAFWSLTANPGGRGHDRSSIGSRDDLAFEPDGSLDLILQPISPGGPQARNWLSIPERAFGIALKMYWPQDRALEGSWRAPGVERLGSRLPSRTSAAPQRNTPDVSPSGPPPNAAGIGWSGGD